MKKCDCKINKDGLESFCVMEDVYGVLCLDCGALGSHGSTSKEAEELWNQGRLQRKVGYFLDGSFDKECIKLGRQIAAVKVDI